jgi:hypothetical protein
MTCDLSLEAEFLIDQLLLYEFVSDLIHDLLTNQVATSMTNIVDTLVNCYEFHFLVK